MTATNVLIPLAGIVSAFVYLTRRSGPGLPKPPGPSPLPLVGNIFNLTAHQLWLTVAEWSKTYGELRASLTFPPVCLTTLGTGKVVYVHVFGQGLIFLNTADACTDLLDKRGTIYSDKPHLVMCGEL